MQRELTKYSAPLVIAVLMTGCGHLTMECVPPTPIPTQLTEPLSPLKEAENSSEVIETHLHNMKQCGACYSRYRGLIEALEARND